MKFRLPTYALIIGATIALAGCSNEGCMNNRNSIPMAGFYSLANEEPLSVSKLAIYGVGAPGDSLLLDTVRSSHQVYLPLRGQLPSVRFAFKSGDLTDTLTINYNSYPFFDGEDCGAMWRYELTSVQYLHTLIDSVFVTDPLISNVERESLMIFLKTE